MVKMTYCHLSANLRYDALISTSVAVGLTSNTSYNAALPFVVAVDIQLICCYCGHGFLTQTNAYHIPTVNDDQRMGKKNEDEKGN
jgi:hypothetical protein